MRSCFLFFSPKDKQMWMIRAEENHFKPCIPTCHETRMSWNWRREMLLTSWRSVMTDGLWERPGEQSFLEPSLETMWSAFKLNRACALSDIYREMMENVTCSYLLELALYTVFQSSAWWTNGRKDNGIGGGYGTMFQRRGFLNVEALC